MTATRARTAAPEQVSAGCPTRCRPGAVLDGDGDPAGASGYADPPPRMGFFTDTSVCIGCKACEVACKEWNHIPEDGLALTGMSYDNTVGLGADTWRHVAFIEQSKPAWPAPESGLRDGDGETRRISAG